MVLEPGASGKTPGLSPLPRGLFPAPRVAWAGGLLTEVATDSVVALSLMVFSTWNEQHFFFFCNRCENLNSLVVVFLRCSAYFYYFNWGLDLNPLLFIYQVRYVLAKQTVMFTYTLWTKTYALKYSIWLKHFIYFWKYNFLNRWYMHIISVLESFQVLFLVPIASSEATHAGFCSLPGGGGGCAWTAVCVLSPDHPHRTERSACRVDLAHTKNCEYLVNKSHK